MHRLKLFFTNCFTRSTKIFQAAHHGEQTKSAEKLYWRALNLVDKFTLVRKLHTDIIETCLVVYVWLYGNNSTDVLSLVKYYSYHQII
jgi:hypothetical protein